MDIVIFILCHIGVKHQKETEMAINTNRQRQKKDKKDKGMTEEHIELQYENTWETTTTKIQELSVACISYWRTVIVKELKLRAKRMTDYQALFYALVVTYWRITNTTGRQMSSLDPSKLQLRQNSSCHSLV